jgi:site-specific recombinase XerD
VTRSIASMLRVTSSSVVAQEETLIRIAGRQRPTKKLTAQSVRRTLAVALRIAGLPAKWTPRELRHSFVSLMSAHGASIELISRLVGHTTVTPPRRRPRRSTGTSCVR